MIILVYKTTFCLILEYPFNGIFFAALADLGLIINNYISKKLLLPAFLQRKDENEQSARL